MDKLLIAQIVTITLFFVGKLWEIISGRVKESRDSMKENTESINRLSIELAETRVLLKMLLEQTQQIPKIKEDLNYAHQKIRDLQT